MTKKRKVVFFSHLVVNYKNSLPIKYSADIFDLANELKYLQWINEKPLIVNIQEPEEGRAGHQDYPQLPSNNDTRFFALRSRSDTYKNASHIQISEYGANFLNRFDYFCVNPKFSANRTTFTLKGCDKLITVTETQGK